MGQTVYLDLFFLINFSMDFLCFYLSGTLLSSKLSKLRMIAGAVLGGLYADASLFLDTRGSVKIAVHILVCILMCATVFGIRSLIAHTLTYVATSAVLGGFMTALFELLNTLEIPEGEIKSDGISAWTLLLLALISGIITLLGARFFRRKSARRYATVSLKYKGKEKTLKGFCDSGNLLCDPLSGKPCVIADQRALDGVISKQILYATPESISILNTDDAKRIRLVPAKTATGTGMLIAVRVDSLELEGRAVDALVVISDIGNNDGCEALIPCELLM